jgi:hypothetical protein
LTALLPPAFVLQHDLGSESSDSQTSAKLTQDSTAEALAGGDSPSGPSGLQGKLRSFAGGVHWTQLLAVLLVLLFWIANRAAYKGYFHGDDLDNLAWNQYVTLDTYLRGILSPWFDRSNFRPTGHFFFFVMRRYADLSYPAYVAVIQVIHILNAWWVWRLLRRLEISTQAAVAGVVVFLFHAATFAAYWMPMYIFDLLCGTFCILSVLSFINRRYLWSLLAFWLAYKAKEVAIMLPVVLLGYKLMVDGEGLRPLLRRERRVDREWLWLVPFFLISLVFGLQALQRNTGTRDAYTLKVTGDSVWQLIQFYGPKLFGSLWLFGAALVVAIAGHRDRRFWWALCSAVLLALPLLALPNRVFAVYLYVPVVFVAIAMGSVVSWRPAILAPLTVLVWCVFTYGEMKRFRNEFLANSTENRLWVQEVHRFLRGSPLSRSFVFDGFPPTLHAWGANGAIHLAKRDPDVRVASVEAPGAAQLLREPRVGVFVWNGATRMVNITSRTPTAADASYVKIDVGMPVWQFGEGWFQRDGSFRWTKPVAYANLYRPVQATRFELQVNAGPQQIKDLGQFRIRVFLDGVAIGESTFDRVGWQIVNWPIEPGPAKLVEIRLEADPPYKTPIDPRTLGAAIGAFGFR